MWILNICKGNWEFISFVQFHVNAVLLYTLYILILFLFYFIFRQMEMHHMWYITIIDVILNSYARPGGYNS